MPDETPFAVGIDVAAPDAERELLLLLAKAIRGAVPLPEGWREVMSKLIAKVERSAE